MKDHFVAVLRMLMDTRALHAGINGALCRLVNLCIARGHPAVLFLMLLCLATCCCKLVFAVRQLCNIFCKKRTKPQGKLTGRCNFLQGEAVLRDGERYSEEDVLFQIKGVFIEANQRLHAIMESTAPGMRPDLEPSDYEQQSPAYRQVPIYHAQSGVSVAECSLFECSAFLYSCC